MISSIKIKKLQLPENQIEEEDNIQKSPVKENRFKDTNFESYMYNKGLSDKLSE